VFQFKAALINAILALAERGNRKVSCSIVLQTTGCNGRFKRHPEPEFLFILRACPDPA
jgi:hypothetical protein